MRLAALLLPFSFSFFLRTKRFPCALDAVWRPAFLPPPPSLHLEGFFFLRDGSFGDAEGEDGRAAAARLIEVRLSPACETKEDGFRSASPEVEGGWREQLEREGGRVVVEVGGGASGWGNSKQGEQKPTTENQIRLKWQCSRGFDFPPRFIRHSRLRAIQTPSHILLSAIGDALKTWHMCDTAQQ